MKYLIKKLATSQLKVVGHVGIGDASLNIAQRGSSVKGFLNGYEIYNISDKKENLRDACTVIAGLIAHVFNKKTEDKLRLYKSEWKKDKEGSINLFDDTVVYLKDMIDDRALIIRSRPKKERDINFTVAPEFSAEKNIPVESLTTNLSILKKKLCELVSEIEDSLDVAETFTRRKLIGTMWGAKAMQGILDGLRDEFLSKYWSQSDVYFEVIENSISRLINKLKTDLLKQCSEEKKMVVSILIPDIISSYEKIKEVVIRLITLLAPLIVIDKTFLNKTSYPARFFIPDEIMEQTQYKFDSLIKFLCLVPDIESNVIDPLDFFRIQMLNQIKE